MSDQKVVMLIDDEEEFLKQLSEMLEFCGYQTECFVSAEQALHDIDKVQPNLVLLDLNMDGMDGFSVGHDIKNNPKTREIPVIVVSGASADGRMSRLKKETGIKRFLEKPVEPLTMIAEVEDVFLENKRGGCS